MQHQSKSSEMFRWCNTEDIMHIHAMGGMNHKHLALCENYFSIGLCSSQSFRAFRVISVLCCFNQYSCLNMAFLEGQGGIASITKVHANGMFSNTTSKLSLSEPRLKGNRTLKTGLFSMSFSIIHQTQLRLHKKKSSEMVLCLDVRF